MGAGLRVELFVADVARTVDFYRRVLGFHLERDDRAAGSAYVALRRDRVAVGVLEVGEAEAVSPGHRRPWTGVELVLELDRLADVVQARDHVVAAGWVLDDDLQERPWGLTDFRLLDPDGYFWRLTHR